MHFGITQLLASVYFLQFIQVTKIYFHIYMVIYQQQEFILCIVYGPL